METEAKFSQTCKTLMTKELAEQFKTFSNFIITNYFGLSANELNELRRNLLKASSKYFVIKNRVGERVLKDLGIKDALDFINGGVGIGFIGGDVVLASKLLVDFSKKHEPFKIKGAYIDGEKIDVAKVEELASLPSREILLSIVVTAFQSPISGFVNILSGVVKKFVYAINAIKNKKEKGGK